MLDIKRLKTAELPEITECIDELYESQKVIDNALTKFKDTLKESWETVSTPIYNIVVNESNQLVPAVDIREIINKYPIETYPDMYAIKLSSIAGDIIKEPELLMEKTTKSVLFRKKS